MCGRFTLRANLNRILQEFAVEAEADLRWEPRFNVAPTQNVLIVKDGGLSLAKWGLVPAWANDAKIGNRLINARADTVADKPSFRSAFKKGRCLVVADGFYEWKKIGDRKQPYFIRLKDDRPFGFAGLAEHWRGDDKVIDSATIITTDANPLMAGIHDRMPVILPRESYGLWLDPEFKSKEELLSLLRPYPAEEMVAIPVSTLVNSPKNEDPCCVNPL
jgi:putative SOS response-associated peptidase YedK